MSLKSSLLAAASQTAPRLSSRVLASSGYSLDTSRFGPPEVFGVWTLATALRQDKAWQPIVEEAREGRPRHDVKALYTALEPLVGEGDASLLEAGCGGGYYSEIIAARFPEVSYQGIDLSPAMIGVAQEHYPDRTFLVGSAYDLPFADASIDIVFDGVALIHMPGWSKALAEYARVARHHVILHGVTITDTSPTTEFAKYAYGQPSLEFVFNRSELLAECSRNGLNHTDVIPGLEYDLQKFIGIRSTEETWVLEVG